MKKLMFIAYKTTNRLSNCILALLIFFVFLSSTTNITSKALEVDGTNYIVSSEEDFKNAIQDINGKESGEYTITLNSDITINSAVTLNCPGSSVTIYGENHTIFSITSYISVIGNSILNLGEQNYNKTLSIVDKPPQTGNACTPLVTANNNAILNMYKGVTLSGRNGVDTAGGIQLEKATFNMYGGKILNCRSDTAAGGVLAYGNSQFKMAGGTISNCDNSHYGGGVFVRNNSKFEMTGGTIQGCTSSGSGGGVYVYNSQFNMSGGTIQDCSSTNYGGGVYTNSNFEMTGGTIKGCTNPKYGGAGVCVRTPSGTNITGFEMSGGKIIDCVSTSDINYGLGGGVLVINGLAHIKEGSEIYNNHASKVGDDIFSFGTNGKLKLGNLPEGLILSETNHEIDGWYVDGVANGEDTDRWDKDNFAQKYIPSPEDVIGTQIALKAAHGAISYDYYNYEVKYYLDGNLDEGLTQSGTADTVHVDNISAPDGYKIDSIDYINVVDPTSQSPGSFEVRVNCTKLVTELKCSVELDGQIINVMLQDSNKALPDDVYMKVELITKDMAGWNELISQLDDKYQIEKLVFFKIKLYYKSDDRPVESTVLPSDVRVLFQIPNGWDKKDLETVLVLADAEDIEFEKEFVTIDGVEYLAFWTKHLTSYALIDKLNDEEVQPSEEENSLDPNYSQGDNEQQTLEYQDTEKDSEKQDFDNKLFPTGEPNLGVYIIFGALLMASSVACVVILDLKSRID